MFYSLKVNNYYAVDSDTTTIDDPFGTVEIDSVLGETLFIV